MYPAGCRLASSIQQFVTAAPINVRDKNGPLNWESNTSQRCSLLIKWENKKVVDDDLVTAGSISPSGFSWFTTFLTGRLWKFNNAKKECYSYSCSDYQIFKFCFTDVTFLLDEKRNSSADLTEVYPHHGYTKHVGINRPGRVEFPTYRTRGCDEHLGRTM